MAITQSWGYAGEVNAPQWAQLLPFAGGAEYGVASPESWRPSIGGGGDRAVTIAPGVGWGYGVMDRNDGPVTLNLPAAGSGSRWDLIVARRIWTTGTTSFARVEGSAARELPPRLNVPGSEDEQPIALVRVQAGSANIAELVDLRLWTGPGGAYAGDGMVLQFMNRLGTRIRIGDTDWQRVLGPLGTLEWVSDGPNLPPMFLGRFRRSDGQLAMNAGNTFMKWQALQVDTIGGSATVGPTGIAYTLPRGRYMVTATAKVAVNAQNYSQMVLTTSGATVLASDEGEWQTPPGFYEMGVNRTIHVESSATVVVYTVSNNAGVLREDGVLRIWRL